MKKFSSKKSSPADSPSARGIKGAPTSIDTGSSDKVMAEYVWIGGGGELRCKTRTLNSDWGSSPDDLPIWNFDGSSTGQAPGNDSEVLMKPIAIFPDPFRGGANILVLTATYVPGTDTQLGEPALNNNWDKCNSQMEACADQEPWFGIEQEYTMFQPDCKTPLGWPVNGYPAPQGPFYCSAGADVAFGRPVVEAHYKACLYAGIKISGVNAEVMPGQWEFQVGPCTGIEQGNHLWMARYLLLRCAEEMGVVISFDPKPIPGDWNGAGCHTNYSTKAMREDGGYEVIKAAIAKMSFDPKSHLDLYGTGNERRLTGAHETASMDQFSWGVANRGASIRVGRDVAREKKGYYEDRRPSSNCDPYLVTGKIVDSTLLNMDVKKQYDDAIAANADFAMTTFKEV